MKLLIKISVVICILTGHYLSMSKNCFSELLCKIIFHVENIREYTTHIILQNANVNNLHNGYEVNHLVNEFFITFIDEYSMGTNLDNVLKSSDFLVLNLSNEYFRNNCEVFSEFIYNKNFLNINSYPNFENINETSYKAFKYNEFSISYLKPKLLDNQDVLHLQKYLKTLIYNSYIPIVIIDKSNLNLSLLKNVLKEHSLFIVLDDNFSISYIKNKPIIHLGTLKDLNLFFQIGLQISNLELKKIILRAFPYDGNKHTNKINLITDILNENKQLNFNVDTNNDYVYFDIDV